MEMLADLAVRQGRTIVVVLHDVGLAARFAHRIILMRQGKVMADGTPREVVTPAIIADGFGVELGVDDSVGWPQPVFLAPISSAAAESQTG
jgi:iron complex transport system ATP-binding protein